MAFLRQQIARSLALVVAVTLLGTAWSVIAGSWLDTSNPLIANLPHPKHTNTYFANKKNVFNTLFVKRAWGWTSLLLLLNIGFNPRRVSTRVWRWILATIFWMSFATWFFGPSVRARVAALSGAECIVQLPVAPVGDKVDVQVISVPAEYCIQRRHVSLAEHAELFQTALLGNTGAGSLSIPDDWRGIPRLTRGHDVSGHVFLLTLSILSLIDNLALGTPAAGLTALTTPQLLLAAAATLLVGLWYWMLLMTSVYFHAPLEKVSGLLVGIVAYFFTLIPSPIGVPEPIDEVAVRIPVPVDRVKRTGPRGVISEHERKLQ